MTKTATLGHLIQLSSCTLQVGYVVACKDKDMILRRLLHHATTLQCVNIFKARYFLWMYKHALKNTIHVGNLF